MRLLTKVLLIIVLSSLLASCTHITVFGTDNTVVFDAVGSQKKGGSGENRPTTDMHKR